MKSVFLLIVACALCCGAPVRAQQVLKRIQFPAGSTTAVMNGRTDSSSSVVYRLSARAGQHLTVHLTSPKKEVFCQIRVTNGHMLPGAQDVTRWEGDLPKGGEYDILVFIVLGADTYSLEVTISPDASAKGGALGSNERQSDPSSPMTMQGGMIKFPPGSSPATIKGHVNPLSSAEYQLNVSANERVAIKLTSTSRKQLVRFHIKRDRVLAKTLPGAERVTEWEGVFKEGGDYWINVFAHPDAGEENFTLVISTRSDAQPGPSDASAQPRLDASRVPAEAAGVEEFVPRGWEIHSRASGDLDGDGRPDLALILFDQSLANARPRSVENPAPALLIVLATEQGRWRRAGLNTHLISSDDSAFAPLRLEIKQGVVVVRQELQSDISANTNDYATTDRFRYDAASGRFLLIGEDNANTQRDAAADGIRVSDNYITGERLITVMHGAGGKYVRETNARRHINPRRVFLEDADNDEVDFDSLMAEVKHR